MSALLHIRRIAEEAGWTDRQLVEKLAAHVDHIGAEMSLGSFLRREAQKDRDGDRYCGTLTTREFLDLTKGQF